MILCVGTSGSGKSVLLRHLQVHSDVSEGVVGVEGEEEGASLRSTIPTVGTNLANLSRSRTKKNQEIAADLMGTCMCIHCIEIRSMRIMKLWISNISSAANEIIHVTDHLRGGGSP